MIKVTTSQENATKIKESNLPCIGILGSGELYLLMEGGDESYFFMDYEGSVVTYNSFNGLITNLHLAPKGTTFTITQK